MRLSAQSGCFGARSTLNLANVFGMSFTIAFLALASARQMTYPALPTSSIVHQIVAAQRVTTQAMGLSRFAARPSCASLTVHSVGDSFQVIWIETRSIPTEVIKLEAIWDRPDEHLIGKDVYRPTAMSNRGVRITAAVNASRPKPTTLLALMQGESSPEGQSFHSIQPITLSGLMQ